MGTESGKLKIVVVRKKVQRRANTAGLQLILPRMLNFRVNRPIMSHGKHAANGPVYPKVQHPTHQWLRNLGVV